MLVALALSLAAFQQAPSTLPLLSSAEFQRACLAVESKLSTADFAAAGTAAEGLPKRRLKIAWRGENLPGLLKETAPSMRDLAIQAWTSRVPDLKITLAEPADIVVDFVDTLPDGPLGIPAASKIEFGTAPRATVHIGLHRNKERHLITGNEVYVEMAHAIGAYLGIADNPLPQSCMYRDDRMPIYTMGPSRSEMLLANLTLQSAERLQTAVANREKFAFARPKIDLQTTRIDVGDVVQGKQVPISVKFANKGAAPLQHQLLPDCGCFSKVAGGLVAADGSMELRMTIDTREFVGTQHKKLVLYTNDPERPTFEIPVTFKSIPAYRFYRPDGDVVIVSSGGASVDAYLTLPPNSTIKPVKVNMDGVDAKVTLTPWQGNLADPDLDEPSMPRQGYRFTVKLADALPPGRSPATITVTTNSTDFPFLRYSMYAQKGIAVLPDSLFLGEVTAAARASVLISRPKQPFKILSIECANPNVTATLRDVGKTDEYAIDATYDGKGPKGDLFAVLKVKTNDPKQPVIEVPVNGSIR